MFLRQLNDWVRTVVNTARTPTEERRSGQERRQLKDRRKEQRFGESTDRRCRERRRR